MAAAPEISSPTAQATIKTGRSEASPTQAWQVMRRHAALSLAELQQARQGQHHQTSRSGNAELSAGQFKHRHAALQQTVAEQRRLLKEQQEQIQHLQERQNILELRHEAEKTTLLATGPPGATNTCRPPKPNTETAKGISEKPSRYYPGTLSGTYFTPKSKVVYFYFANRQSDPHIPNSFSLV